MDIQEVIRLCEMAREQVRHSVIGKDEVIDRVMTALLAGGHILIEDVPGLAKTLLANSFARALQMTFSRIQFTPDLLPGDITGSNIFDQKEGRFKFVPGPIFANLILADEINRASPKTQSALLEAMQEQHVTIEGVGHPLESPFTVIATQNPIEFEGTYPLPEAQLDRFIMKIDIGYPDEETEVAILTGRQDRKRDEVTIESVLGTGDLMEMRSVVEDVYMDERLCRYAVALVRETRVDARVAIGASPRGTLALFKLSRAFALLKGRDFVTPEDIKEIAVAALFHRIILKPEIWVRKISEKDVIGDLLRRVPVPAPVEQT